MGGSWTIEVSAADFGASPEISTSTDLGRALTQAALKSQQTEAFIAAAGRVLCYSPLHAKRLFVSMRALHPAFRARTYLWTQDANRVHTIE